jgi:hypothetical protein
MGNLSLDCMADGLLKIAVPLYTFKALYFKGSVKKFRAFFVFLFFTVSKLTANSVFCKFDACQSRLTAARQFYSSKREPPLNGSIQTNYTYIHIEIYIRNFFHTLIKAGHDWKRIK